MRVLDATGTRRSRSGDIIEPDQRVDVIPALKAMTIWPAWHYFEDKSKGSIEEGKLADLVILSADPTTVDRETLDELKLVETIKEGSTVFSLTEPQKKQGNLMLKRDRNGDYAFSRFLREAAIQREFQALPANQQTPFARTALASGRHDQSCLGPVMNDMAAAIVSSSMDKRQ